MPDHPSGASTTSLIHRLRTLADYAADAPPSLMNTDMVALMREAATELAVLASPVPPTTDPEPDLPAGEMYDRYHAPEGCRSS